ncbi:zinc finger MYM-type protein 1-like, partial [Myzus persicae]|uniref:zinc finger MYM-type protein 1-like n=1 Tax=Myzus persicae TaxID=13164 RepID=UPI000B939B47
MNNKKKRSGAENRSIKKKKANEDVQLSKQMKDWFSKGSVSDEKSVDLVSNLKEYQEDKEENSGDSNDSFHNKPILVGEEIETCVSSITIKSSEIIQDISSDIHEPTPSSSTSFESFFQLINCNDPPSWPPITDSVRVYLVTQELDQGKDADFSKSMSDDGRRFSPYWFKKTLPNNEVIDRNWLIYSKNSKAVFCFPCCLFKSNTLKTASIACTNEGFLDWKNINRILDHEKSADHRNHFLQWKSLENRLKNSQCIDDKLQMAILLEKDRWRHILRIILDAILFCTKNNLAFRGSSTTVGNKHSAKYFSLLFDCTPDVSHNEQMAEVIRYVDIDNGKITVEESFIDFINTEEKTGDGLAMEILTKLKADELDVQNVRGQGYDNGANMSGKYHGVQAVILNKNNLATFIPCAAHCLNLSGVHAASANVKVQFFFDVIQKIYTFFVKSTTRWKILMDTLKISLKGHSDTRWASKAQAVKAMNSQIKEVFK